MNGAAPHRYVLYTAELACPAPLALWDRLATLAAPAFLWRGREPGAELWVALGAAERFHSLTEARAALIAAEESNGRLTVGPRGFAAFPFNPQLASGAILLPELLIRWQDGQASIIAVTSAGRLAAQVVELLSQPVTSTPVPRMVDGGRMFSKAAWQAGIDIIRREIREGNLTKAVLARDSFRVAQSLIPVGSLLECLDEDGADSYRIAFGTAERVFVSASPERLLRCDDLDLQTESLAGTRPRGGTPHDDAHWAAELLQSAKDRTEQAVVTQFIAAALDGLCETIEFPQEPSLRRLATVQHLVTPVTARLRPDTTLDHVLQALHPTPAVCGLPREPARDLIRNLEPQPRGFYAGALGWLDPRAAEFAVGIRAAVVEKNSATVYAGAGIVAESNADAEWKESSWKMFPLLRALGCAHP